MFHRDLDIDLLETLFATCTSEFFSGINSQPYLLHYGVHFYIVLCLCVKCTWTLGIWLMWPGCWYTCDPLHQCGPVRWPSWAVQVWGCQLYPAGRPANVPRSAESTCPHCCCDSPEKKRKVRRNFKKNIYSRRSNESTWNGIWNQFYLEKSLSIRIWLDCKKWTLIHQKLYWKYEKSCINFFYTLIEIKFIHHDLIVSWKFNGPEWSQVVGREGLKK